MSDELVMEIRGLRARPMKLWRDVLLAPVLVLVYAFMSGGMHPLTIVLGVLGAIFVLWLWLRRMARGLILLTESHLDVQRWEWSGRESFKIELARIHKVNVAGSVLRLGYTSSGSEWHARIDLIAPVAEELFDRIVAQLEGLPDVRERLRYVSQHRVLVD